MKQIAFIALALMATGCARNVDEAKACAPKAFQEMGYEIIGYQGYNLSLIYGGLVWYNLRKVPDNGITYEAAVSPWAGECHVYGLKALDAIKP